MRFAALHKICTYLVAGFGLILLFGSGEVAPWLVGAGVLAAALSWFAEGERLGRRAWIQSWNGLTALLAGLQVLRALLGAPVLTVGVEFAVFLQINKLWNRRGARDYQQITVLALLHLIAATVLETDLTYAAAFVGFTVVSPW